MSGSLSGSMTTKERLRGSEEGARIRRLARFRRSRCSYVSRPILSPARGVSSRRLAPLRRCPENNTGRNRWFA
jgi:hypothetical protein